MPEEESLQSLEATSENRHRECGRDMLGQTVPSMGSSNREDIINGGLDSRVHLVLSILHKWRHLLLCGRPHQHTISQFHKSTDLTYIFTC